jgi:hypothetical protein
LKHYFQAHEITVSTSQPLGDILRNKEASDRIGKWAIELPQFTITYVPRTAIKSQALVDFMANWIPPAAPPAALQHDHGTMTWTVYTDGA